MAVKLMTGATGEQNIEAADDRECLAGVTGLDSYVFRTGDMLKATAVDSNTVSIGTGAGSMQGTRFRVTEAAKVTIRSGTQGQSRHDIIGLRFSRDASGKESLALEVLTGKPADGSGATDPVWSAGDLSKGDSSAFMPLYRVKLSGINISEPDPMFSVLTPLADLGKSLSVRVVDCNISGVPTTVTRTGNIVVVAVCGTLKQSVDSWGSVKLSTTMPKARPERCNALLMCQDDTDGRVLLSVSGTTLLIESKGGAYGSGSWVFGQLVYICQ